MRKWLWRSLWALIAFLAVAQLVPVSRTNPPVTGDIGAPPPVDAILRRACYDCHSSETAWPWYSRIAPASWLLAYDVSEGRRELDYSAWASYDAKRRAKKFKETIEEVGEGEMPPWYYVLLHPEARLAESDVEALRRWAEEGMAKPASP